MEIHINGEIINYSRSVAVDSKLSFISIFKQRYKENWDVHPVGNLRIHSHIVQVIRNYDHAFAMLL